MTMSSTTISGNSAHLGGGIFGYAGTIRDTVFTANSATEGGGIYAAYGGTISNATLAGNSATYGGGIANNSAKYGGILTLTNSTLSGNSAKVGGGINNYTGNVSHLNNTLIAGNTASGSDPDVLGGVIASSGFNLIGDGTGMTGITNGVNGNHIGTSTSPIHPLLATLGNYGGSTKTFALLPGSPALDAGSNALDGGVTTDQRGRPRIIHGTVDIGAFESQGFTVAVSAGNNQSTVINTPFASALAVTVSSSAGEPVGGGVVRFTAPSSGASAVLSATRVTLNGSGQGSVTATANNVAGSYQVVVSARGANANASFTLTNRAHAATLSAGVASTSMPRAEAFFSPTVSALDALVTPRNVANSEAHVTDSAVKGPSKVVLRITPRKSDKHRTAAVDELFLRLDEAREVTDIGAFDL
jgi:predicted outer membrane repeat protein